MYQIYKAMDNGAMTPAEGRQELDRLGKINTDWFKEIFRTGLQHNHNITLSGGNEKTQYYANLSYLGEKGIIPNNKYQTIGGSVKLSHDFNKWLRINFDVRSTVRTDQSTASVVNPLYYATYANPYERPYDENGGYDYDRSYAFEYSQIQDGQKYNLNVLEDLRANTSKTRYLNNQMILKLEVQLIEGLMLTTMGTYGNNSSTTTQKIAPGTYTSKYRNWLNSFYSESEVDDMLNNGNISERTMQTESWTIRNQLEFARGLSGDRHYLNIVVGQEVSATAHNGFSSMIPEWSNVYGVGTYPDLTGMTLTSTTSGAIARLGGHEEYQDRQVSLYATGSFSLWDKYIFQASGRLDGADIIGTKNRFHPLWNVSGKWNLHNEEFMKAVHWINQLALRVSYGYVGSIDRNALPFSTMSKVESSAFLWDGERVMDRYYPSNPSIKWQKTEDRSVGIDISMLNHRVNLTVGYYDRISTDVLGSNKLPLSTGRHEMVANIASLSNTGWEFGLRTTNVRTRNFSWTTSFNISFNKDEVTDTYYKDLTEVSASTNSTMDYMYQLYVKGQPIRAFYAYRFAGVDPLTGGSLVYVDGVDADGKPLGSLNEQGRYVYNIDQTLTVQLANASRRYIGRSDPPVTGGFSTQFNLGRWSLSGQFSFMTGFLSRSYLDYNKGTVMNSGRNLLRVEANRWRKPGDDTDVPKYENGRTEYIYQLFDIRFEKGNFLKCNNISLGYNLPPDLCRKLRLTRARVNLNMFNVFTLTKFRGIDPETKQHFTYPSARSYKLSVSVGF